MKRLLVVALLLTGCSSFPLPKIEVQTTNDTELQKKLDKDPAFQDMMDHIRMPKDNHIHYSTSVSAVQDRGHHVIAHEYMASVKGTW